MAIEVTSFFPRKGKKPKKFCLQDNGVYWFLCPYFKRLFERTGQSIDLYGTSNFRGSNLLELDNTLADAIKGIAAQPDQWDQKVGVMIKPKKQVLYDRVSKKNVLMVINVLKNITTEAIKCNAVIVFEGL
jgi:hypothetical protein